MSGQVAQPHQQQQQTMIDSATTASASGYGPNEGNLITWPTNRENNTSNRLHNTNREPQTTVAQVDGGNSNNSLQQSDDNSTGSLNGAASTTAGLRRAAGADRRLSVVLPQTEKSLLTPTIITSEQGATPTQLFSSLIQLNGQELSLFTGLPSCTPTSADGLACAGINPFFWGVASFDQQQKASPRDTSTCDEPQQQSHQNDNNLNADNYHHMQANYGGDHYAQQQPTSNHHHHHHGKGTERPRQLSKLSVDQLQAANVILTSPLSFLLSPEHETWLRLGLKNHPLAGKSGGPPTGCNPSDKQQHHQLMPPSSQAAYARLSEHPDYPNHPLMAATYANHHQHHQTAQDLTSGNQIVAHRLNSSHNSPISNQQATAYLQQVPPTGPQYSTCNLAATTYSNNSTMQQNTAAPIPAAVVPNTTSSSFPNQQQSTPTRSPNFASQLPHLPTVEGQQQLYTAQDQADTSTPIQSIAMAADKRAATRNEPNNGREAHLGQQPVVARPVQGSMGPPVAHHQQLQPHQPHHHQGALLVMGHHQLDPRFVEFHHHHHHQQQQQQIPTTQPNRLGQTLHVPLQYEPHLQQLYLAQQQQEIYNLQRNQHHNSNFKQQQALPTYQLMPNGQTQQEQHQSHPLPAQPTPAIRYRTDQTGVNHEATIENGTTNPRIEDHSSNMNYMDSSSSSNNLGSASVSPRRSDHRTESSNNSSSSTRSSVSRDTNSLDVIATKSIDGSMHSDTTQVQSITSTKTDASKQVAATKTNNKKNGDKLEDVGSVITADDQSLVVKKKSKGGRKKKVVTNEELMARKNRSKERNRVAAKRCRQKRKQFLDELRGRIDSLNDSNKKLYRENNRLKGELEQLRKHHKNCAI